MTPSSHGMTANRNVAVDSCDLKTWKKKISSHVIPVIRTLQAIKNQSVRSSITASLGTHDKVLIISWWEHPTLQLCKQAGPDTVVRCTCISDTRDVWRWRRRRGGGRGGRIMVMMMMMMMTQFYGKDGVFCHVQYEGRYGILEWISLASTAYSDILLRRLWRWVDDGADGTDDWAFLAGVLCLSCHWVHCCKGGCDFLRLGAWGTAQRVKRWIPELFVGWWYDICLDFSLGATRVGKLVMILYCVALGCLSYFTSSWATTTIPAPIINHKIECAAE